MARPLNTPQFLSYGSLGFALAFVGLPLYLYIPKYYAEELGVSLQSIGILIIFSRLIDTVQDPIIGYYCDKVRNHQISRLSIMMISAFFLVPFFYFLLHPMTTEYTAPWFFVTLTLCYTAYSFITINYFSTAAELTKAYIPQTKLTTSREGFGLLGVALASALPSFLNMYYTPQTTYFIWFLVFSGTCAVALTLLWKNVPFRGAAKNKKFQPLHFHFSTLVKNKKATLLTSVYFINSISAGIPATLVLFYIDEVIGAPHLAGYFLMVYFLGAVAAMPLWPKLTALWGKKRLWLVSMLLTVCVFLWAGFLGNGDIIPYFLVCLTSGIFLGVDLSTPPSMLADTLIGEQEKGLFFGLWTMVSKMSLALASGFSLILITSLGYESKGELEMGKGTIIAISYGFFPCLFRLLAMVLLYKSTLDNEKK